MMALKWIQLGYWILYDVCYSATRCHSHSGFCCRFHCRRIFTEDLHTFRHHRRLDVSTSLNTLSLSNIRVPARWPWIHGWPWSGFEF